MRKRVVTTVLTIGGVLVAGSAAALVNSSILGGSSARIVAGGPSGDETPDTGPLTTDELPVTGTSLPTEPLHRSGTTADYPVGECGTVTIDSADDELLLVAVDPATGWSVVGTDDGDDVRVVFRSGSTEVTFRATLLYGVVSTSVQTRTLGAVPGDDSGDDGSDDDHSGGGSDSTVDDGSDDETEITEPEDTEDTEVDDDAVDDDSVDDSVVKGDD